MSKSVDLRKTVVDYHLSGHILKETSEIFGVGKSMVSEWRKKYRETGDLSNKPLNRSFKKIDPEKLKQYVKEHPDAAQQEMAEEITTPHFKWGVKKRPQGGYEK